MARYKHLSLDGIIQEMMAGNRSFYSLRRILSRVASNLWHPRQALINLVGNLSYRSNSRANAKTYADFKWQRRGSFRQESDSAATPHPPRVAPAEEPAASAPQGARFSSEPECDRYVPSHAAPTETTRTLVRKAGQDPRLHGSGVR